MSLRRQLPTAARRIGFQLETPEEVELQPGDTVRCSERRDGQTIGELEVETFHAALVIDRDGILEEKVQQALASAVPANTEMLPTMPVELPGASGFRGDAETRGELPYVYVYAIAPNDLALDGGLLVTIRCARPEWPAADAILRSLRLLSRRGVVANDTDDSPPLLPIVGRRT